MRCGVQQQTGERGAVTKGLRESNAARSGNKAGAASRESTGRQGRAGRGGAAGAGPAPCSNSSN